MISDRDLLSRLGNTGNAFFGKFCKLHEIQRLSVEPILAGRSILVTSATASGKTEAIFAPLVQRISQSVKMGNHIRILAIAPTRALVNDLYSRLESILDNLGWSCGRQTSDHRDKQKKPNLLITTPESFDSMLVRNGEYVNGSLHDHLLARVEAVFIDEAHLFDGCARGDQLIWLLGRLRRLRSFAEKHQLVATGSLQICGASATVAEPELLAKRLLGEAAQAIVVSGSRQIEVLLNDQTDEWRDLGHFSSADKLCAKLISADGQSDLEAIYKQIWRALQIVNQGYCRKILVFVPTRALCDRLSLFLRESLQKVRAMEVYGHHGSLDKSVRESAEQFFLKAKDAVLVATTTLEVGIDIGNVDAIVLVGPPPDTGSLLQRIGRGGRRTGKTRVVPIVRDWIEAAAMGSMLLAAQYGVLDEKPYARRWSVFVQQVGSLVAQGNRTRGRTKHQILSLAQEVWPDANFIESVPQIINHLIESLLLVEVHEQLRLGEIWSDRIEKFGGDLHSNFDAVGSEIPVVDSSTGEIIARVQNSINSGNPIALGSRRWEVVCEYGEILLKPATAKADAKTFRYAARAAPTSRIFAQHVLTGLGFKAQEAPYVIHQSQDYWFHFGGDAYEILLLKLFPNLRPVRGLNGFAVRNIPDSKQIAEQARLVAQVRNTINDLADKIAFYLSPGPRHRELPENIRNEVIVNLFSPEHFCKWLASRVLRPITVGEAPDLKKTLPNS